MRAGEEQVMKDLLSERKEMEGLQRSLYPLHSHLWWGIGLYWPRTAAIFVPDKPLLGEDDSGKETSGLHSGGKFALVLGDVTLHTRCTCFLQVTTGPGCITASTAPRVGPSHGHW